MWEAHLNAPARATAAAGLLMLAACASPPPKDRPSETGPPAQAAARSGVPVAASAAASEATAAATDASFDWHALVVAPFGTLLKDSPIRLHEVLLFHDESLGSAGTESKDCYAVDGTAPTFIGRAPDEYLMCFEHDRLDRIDASVRIAVDHAARDFGRACARWLGNAQPVIEADDVCEGRDGDIAFSARLVVEPGDPTAEVFMTLADAARPDAERAPPLDPQTPSPAAP